MMELDNAVNASFAKIKVIGVGGAGNNAVKDVYKRQTWNWAA